MKANAKKKLKQWIARAREYDRERRSLRAALNIEAVKCSRLEGELKQANELLALAGEAQVWPIRHGPHSERLQVAYTIDRRHLEMVNDQKKYLEYMFARMGQALFKLLR